jgi:uncharacterized membrane protein
MSGFLLWAALTLLLTGGFVAFFLCAVPIVITGAVLLGFRRRMGDRPEGRRWFNHLILGGPAKSGEDRVVMTSPDMIYMLGVYDVRQEPVVIHCAVPACDTYWCISLYRRNTDNFYVRNDRASEQREFDLVLTGPQGSYHQVGNEEVVRAPRSRGIVVIRAVIRDRADEEEIARVQATLKQTTMTPLSQRNLLSRRQAERA